MGEYWKIGENEKQWDKLGERGAIWGNIENMTTHWGISKKEETGENRNNMGKYRKI